jgi:hypothetical protein
METSFHWHCPMFLKSGITDDTIGRPDEKNTQENR